MVTAPFFYTLDKFEIDAFVRIRVFVGLNSAITDIIRDIESLEKDEDSKSLESSCEFEQARYEIPDLPEREPEPPTVFQEALELAETDSTLANRTAISLDEFLGPLIDNYSPDRGALEGQSLGPSASRSHCPRHL